MPAIDISASVEIDAACSLVQRVLADFTTWPGWSPWLYVEPEAAITYQGDGGRVGHAYDWDGQRVGAGRMALRLVSPERVECALRVTKPFRSRAEVAFDLLALEGERTRVTWSLASRLPFFMGATARHLRGVIRADYERGLALLKDYVERGTVPSTTTAVIEVDLDPMPYVGVRRPVTPIDRVGATLEQAFEQLAVSARRAGLGIDGPPFALYLDRDAADGFCDVTAALPLAAGYGVGTSGGGAGGLVYDERPGGRALQVTHTGPYRHLGNAWSVLFNEARHRRCKPAREAVPFERYVSAGSTPEDAFVTELFLPLRVR